MNCTRILCDMADDPTVRRTFLPPSAEGAAAQTLFCALARRCSSGVCCVWSCSLRVNPELQTQLSSRLNREQRELEKKGVAMAARPFQFEGLRVECRPLREHCGCVSEALGEDLRDGASVFCRAGRFFEVLDIAYHK